MLAVEELWARVNQTVSQVLPEPWPGLESGMVAGGAFLILVVALTRLHGFAGAGLVSPVVGAVCGLIGVAVIVLTDVLGMEALRQLGVESAAAGRVRWVLPWAALLLVIAPVTRWAFRANYWTSAVAWVLAVALAGMALWAGGNLVGRLW